jgi:hypothetical protein
MPRANCYIQPERSIIIKNLAEFREVHEARIMAAIECRRLKREAIWTAAIAVGRRDYVQSALKRVRMLIRLRTGSTEDGIWYLCDGAFDYGR